MPYIGNPIYQSAFVTDTFSGDGTTTAFTMSVAPAGTSNVLVVVSGVVQDPSTYGVVGNTLTFTGAPPSGTGNISCRYLGVPVTGVTTTAYRTVTEFTATAGQTTFTPASYNVGFINVYRNGVLLGSADYTATNGTTVVLATGATAGDLVTVESFLISSVSNAISNTAGSVNSNNIADGAVGTAEIADSAVTPAKLSTGGPYWNTSGQVGINTSSPNRLLTLGGSGDQYISRSVENGAIILAAGSGITSGATAGGFVARGGSSSYNTGGIEIYTGGTETMRIDSSGRVTTPYQPAFKAQWANQSYVFGGGEAAWDTAVFNIGSHYNTANGRFTAPVAGVYQFNLTIQHYGGTGSVGWQDIRVNGAEVNARFEDLNAASLFNAGGLSVTLYLNAGDYASCISNSAIWWSDNSSFSGFLVG